MALTAERRRQLEAIAGRSNVTAGVTPTSSGLTPERRAELQQIANTTNVTPERRTFGETVRDVAQDIGRPIAKTIASGVAPVASARAVGQTLLEGGTTEEAARAGDIELSRPRRTGFGTARPVGFEQDTGRKLGVGRSIADIVGTGLETGATVLPAAGGVGGAIARQGVRRGIGAGVRLGASEGALQLGGRELQQPDVTPGSLALQTGIGAITGGAIGGAAAGLGGIGTRTATQPGRVRRLVGRGAELAQEQVEGLPARVMNSLIRPTNKAFNFGKNPGKTLSELGVTANSFDDLATKITQQKDQFGRQIADLIATAPTTRTISRQQMLQPLDDAIKAAVESGEQALVTRLQGVRRGLTEISGLDPATNRVITVGSRTSKLTIQEAFELKRQIGAASKWTGQAFDNDVNQARVAVYRNLKRAIEEGVGQEQKTELVRLNNLFGNLIEAESAAQRRAANAARVNLLSLPQIGTAGAGAVIGGGPGAVVGLVLNKVAGTVAFKTRAAKALQQVINKMTPAEQRVLVESLPALEPAIAEMSQTEVSAFIKALPAIIKVLQPGLVGTTESVGNTSPNRTVR